ncbi:MAG: 2-nitropropane dioxygenase, partial [Chloroflexi bacterium]|nr:2-nitropropane dioxygenase [Chloroflexota bacterium]
MQTLTVSRPLKNLLSWNGAEEDIITNPDEISATLRDLTSKCYLLEYKDQIGISRKGFPVPATGSDGKIPLIGSLKAISPGQMGDPAFLAHHGVKSAYMAGSMANAISGEALVTALGRSGFLASFGSGGVSPARLVQAITTIKKALPDGPYAFNLIHSPQEPALEQKAVDLFLKHGINTIEASAF